MKRTRKFFQLHLGLSGGKVPPDYYIDLSKAMPRTDEEITVYPGNKHVLEIDVQKPGSTLWCVIYKVCACFEIY